MLASHRVHPIRAVARALTEMEIWPIAIGVVAGIVLERTLLVTLAVAAVWWVFRTLAYGFPSVRTPADWAIGLLSIMLLVTLWATVLPETTRPQVYRLVSGIALYYTIVNWTTTLPRLRLLIAGLLIGGTLLALVAPLTVDWSGGKLPFIPAAFYERFTLLVSDTINPNVMAGLLILLLAVALAMLMFGWAELSWLARVLVGLAVLIMSGMLLITQSRGALLGLVAAFLLLVLLRWRYGWVLPLVAAVIALVAMQFLDRAVVFDLLTTNRTLAGLDVRLEIWSRAIYMIQDFPFTGIGMGSFKTITDLFYPLFLSVPDTIEHAHNLFLQIAVDLGLPGLIAWLAILLVVCASSWQTYRYASSMGNGWLAGVGAGLFCSQVALVVHGMTDAVTWGMVRPAVLVWGLWGIAIASWQICHPEVSSQS